MIRTLVTTGAVLLVLALSTVTAQPLFGDAVNIDVGNSPTPYVRWISTATTIKTW